MPAAYARGTRHGPSDGGGMAGRPGAAGGLRSTGSIEWNEANTRRQPFRTLATPRCASNTTAIRSTCGAQPHGCPLRSLLFQVHRTGVRPVRAAPTFGITFNLYLQKNPNHEKTRLLLLCLCALHARHLLRERRNPRRFTTPRATARLSTGSFTSDNMHFYGTATVTDTNGNSFSDEEAWFEFAGDRSYLVLYMHATRLPQPCRRSTCAYCRCPIRRAGEPRCRLRSVRSFPRCASQRRGGGYSYRPLPSYTLTEVEGSIEDVNCRIGFTCAYPQHGYVPHGVHGTPDHQGLILKYT